MTATTSNNFQNYSGPSGLNRGGNGKFTPSQTEERLKVHAMALVRGVPTLAQICQIWKERFNIDITIPSEKEWRANNRDGIEKKKLALVESGEIEVPVVSEEVLSDSLMNSAISTSQLATAVRKRAKAALAKLDIDDATDLDKAKVQISAFKALISAVHQLSSDFTNQTEQLFIMSGKIKIKDNQIKELVNKRFDERMADAEEEGDEIQDPMSFEVTDEMREKLKDA